MRRASFGISLLAAALAVQAAAPLDAVELPQRVNEFELAQTVQQPADGQHSAEKVVTYRNGKKVARVVLYQRPEEKFNDGISLWELEAELYRCSDDYRRENPSEKLFEIGWKEHFEHDAVRGFNFSYVKGWSGKGDLRDNMIIKRFVLSSRDNVFMRVEYAERVGDTGLGYSQSDLFAKAFFAAVLGDSAPEP